MALHTFVWLYFFNLLPSISRCVGQPREYLQGLMSRSIRRGMVEYFRRFRHDRAGAGSVDDCLWHRVRRRRALLLGAGVDAPRK